MDAIVEAYEKNRSEIVPTLVSGFFVVFFLYFFYKQLNISPLQSISIFERMLAVFIVSYVLGKIFFILGLFISNVFSVLLFQDNKLSYLKVFWEEFCESHSRGKKKVLDEVSITNMEIFDYLGENQIANLEYQKEVTNMYYWVTFFGGSVIFWCFSIFFSMSCVAPFVIVLFSLLATLLNRTIIVKFRHDLAVMIGRRHLVSSLGNGKQ